MSEVDVKVKSIENLSDISMPYINATIVFLETVKMQGLKYINGAEVKIFIKKKNQTLTEIETEAKNAALDLLKRLIKSQA